MKYLLLVGSLCLVLNTTAQHIAKAPEIGVVQEYENAAILKGHGYQYLIESTQKLFSPEHVSREQFSQHLEHIKKLELPMYGSNLFIPGHLKMVGPEVDQKALLAYVEEVFQRGQAAGIEVIIWGSGGSRQIPPGFEPDKAKEQFVFMARKIAEVAKKYDIMLALESLNSTECNFINTVAEALEVVKSVDHDNFRLCADIYHMLKEGESPGVLVTARDYLVYCEIAEKDGRTPPGVNQENFTPYLAALKQAGYTGKIIIECRWKDIDDQGATAYQYLQDQINQAYSK